VTALRTVTSLAFMAASPLVRLHILECRDACFCGSKPLQPRLNQNAGDLRSAVRPRQLGAATNPRLERSGADCAG
jgi:hypothetical protein